MTCWRVLARSAALSVGSPPGLRRFGEARRGVLGEQRVAGQPFA